jgi:hypothetical protein
MESRLRTAANDLVRDSRQGIYSAKKVAATATTPTSALDAESAPAPLFLAAPWVGAEDALELEAELVAEEASDDVLDDAALTALVMSAGMTSGASPDLPRSTEPSAFMMSGLAARTLRVNMMFSSMSDCDQPGMLLMSIDEPHMPAIGLFEVIWLEYETIAAMLESLAAMPDIIIAAEEGAPAALGGLL